MIEFTPQQLAAFTTARENELAKWVWERMKTIYPERAPYVADNDKSGIDFMRQSIRRANPFLTGLEEDADYNRWRIVFAAISYVLGARFEMQPWTRGILTETLWHPYQRIDLIAGVNDITFSNPDNRKFFEALGELTS